MPEWFVCKQVNGCVCVCVCVCMHLCNYCPRWEQQCKQCNNYVERIVYRDWYNMHAFHMQHTIARVKIRVTSQQGLTSSPDYIQHSQNPVTPVKHFTNTSGENDMTDTWFHDHHIKSIIDVYGSARFCDEVEVWSQNYSNAPGAGILLGLCNSFTSASHLAMSPGQAIAVTR